MVRLAIAAVVLSLLLPVASGQPSQEPPATFSIVEEGVLPNGRLVPETGVAQTQLLLEVGCGLAPSLEQSTVQFAVVETAAYANVTLNPPVAHFKIPPEACADTAYREPIRTEAILVTTRAAPAMATFMTKISATVDDEHGRYGPFLVQFEVVNDFLPLTVADPDQLFAKAEPGQTVLFHVELQNHGNGPVVVTSEVAQPNKNKLDLVDPGPAVRLESRADKGPQAAFKEVSTIRVGTPLADGYVNQIYQFNVKYSSRFDGNASGVLPADEQTLAFAVQVQGGLGVGSPDVSPILLVGVVAVLASVLRRRP